MVCHEGTHPGCTIMEVLNRSREVIALAYICLPRQQLGYGIQFWYFFKKHWKDGESAEKNAVSDLRTGKKVIIVFLSLSERNLRRDLIKIYKSLSCEKTLNTDVDGEQLHRAGLGDISG